MKRIKNFALILTLILFAIPATAAQADPHMGWRVIDFIIFVGILYYFLHKPISDFFRNRKLSIKQAIEDAEHLLEKSKNKLSETEKLYQTVDEQIAKIQSLYQRKAELQSETIISKAKEMAESYRLNINEALTSEQEAAKKILFKELFDKMEHQLVETLKKSDKNVHKKINEKIIASLRSL